MADFNKAFELIKKNEGGYVNDPDDPGGETYKGVARNFNAGWPGWSKIDLLKKTRGFPRNLENDRELQDHVKTLYAIKYWHKIGGGDIESQMVAESLFDFAVNAGPAMAARLAQKVVDADPDGVVGPKTIAALNAMSPELFLSQFALAKVARYVYICEKKPERRKYFYGWISRTLRSV